MQTGAFLKHVAFAAAMALLSALAVRLMIALRLMDTPDARKAHDRPTPKGGGVGIVAAFVTGTLILYQYASFARLADQYFLGLIAASAAIAVVALLDDWWDFPFFVKLGAQVLAALAAVGTGLYVSVFTIPGFGAVDVGLLGVPLATGYILFLTNAMNFIDGLNGLASGVTLIAAGFLAFLAASQSGWFAYFASLLLAAGVAGFLPFNFPRARIFMGDVGSQFCGFTLAILGIAAARFGGVPLSFLVMPLLLNGVLYDVAFTLCRRALRGERLTEAHRGHLYQLAHRAGMNPVVIALLHWGFAALGGLACLALMDAAAALRPLAIAAVLVPQLAWTACVIRRARRAGVPV
jgi:UDP-GlcNAc:undecaprenyl-phosphate GlcNAc-1-phosphate transferase